GRQRVADLLQGAAAGGAAERLWRLQGGDRAGGDRRHHRRIRRGRTRARLSAAAGQCPLRHRAQFCQRRGDLGAGGLSLLRHHVRGEPDRLSAGNSEMSVRAPAASAAASVAIVGLSKTYESREGGDDIRALDQVDVAIAPGSFVAVVGPSGCGKSTMLSLLAGLIPATTGKIRIDGEEVRKPHRKVGVVFQTDLLLYWRSVLDNILLPAEIKRLDRREYRERARQLLG